MVRAGSEQEGRARWSEADARRVLEDIERSGESVSSYCARVGLDRQRVYAWRRRLESAPVAPLAAASGSPVESTRFIELVMSGARSDVGDGLTIGIELSWGDVRLRIPEGFVVAELASVVGAVSRGLRCG